MLRRLQQLGPYSFLLDCIARFFTGERVSQRIRLFTAVALVFGLFVVAWLGADWFTLRSGEMPGTVTYVSTKLKYLMRLLCCEWLLLAGALFATYMEMENGRISRPHMR